MFSSSCLLIHIYVCLYLKCLAGVNSSLCLFIPMRCSALTQQCCYDNSGQLLTDARDARSSVSTPLYDSLSGMLTYYRETVLPFVYCCKEGLPEGDSPSPCGDFQSALSADNGDDYMPLVPGQWHVSLRAMCINYWCMYLLSTVQGLRYISD